MISIFTEHVTQGLNRLLAQFQGKENIAAVVTAFLNEIQEAETALFTLLNDRTIANGSGDVLDLIGKIVGQPRMGLNDSDYRIWLQARLAINRSSGTTEQIIDVISAISGFIEDGDIEITEEDYPATFKLTIHQPLGTIDPVILKEIVDTMRSAAVYTEMIYFVTDPVFQFDSGYGFDQGHLAGQL